MRTVFGPVGATMKRTLAVFGVVGFCAFSPSLVQAQRGGVGMGHAASAPVAMHSGGVAMSRAAGVRAVASSGLRATSSRPAMVSHVRVSNGVIHVVRRNPSTVRTVVAHSQNFIDDANAVPGLG